MQLADSIRKARQVKNKLSHPSCAAVIVAAGSSARMGGTDKLLAELGGLPVLSRTLRAFDDHDMIDTIIVVAREEQMPKISRVCSPYHKVRIVVPGGNSRQESVMHGLEAVPEGTELVAVHDGARPLVEQRVIEDGEAIRDELLKTVFGVWDHIKNGGKHGAENYELEWVGFLPGKRESRRVLGDYVLKEQDCQNAARFEDTVAYGGWPMDVHVIEGFRSRSKEANEFLCLDDVYAIPYRCFYSRNVKNLMLAGRDISCSHMAFASTRVMGTCAVGGQAVGVAASMAAKRNVLPCEISADIRTLQQKLLRQDCYLPGIAKADPLDAAADAVVEASSWQCGAEPQNVLNGYSRTVGAEKNYWQSESEAAPWLQLKLPQPRYPREVQLLFDSDLSREIMISLSEMHLAEQEKGTPSTLVKRFTLDFMLHGKVVDTMTIHNNYQRRVPVRRETPISCDAVKLTIRETYGTRTPKVFEIRLYE